MLATNGTPVEPHDPYADLDLARYMGTLKDSLNGYVRTEKELLKMQAAERAGSVMSDAVVQVVRLVCFGGLLLFLNIALSLYVGELANSYPIGFAVGGAVYLLIYGIFHLWWGGGGKNGFIVGRINDLIGDKDEDELH